MTSKAALALAQLEQELEVVSKEQQAEIKGGMGVVTGGSGTQQDPYVISASYYYYGLDAAQSAALQAAAGSFSSGGVIAGANGKYFRISVSAIGCADAATARNMANSAQRVNQYGETQNWGNTFTIGSDPNASVFGSTSGNTLNLINSNINNTYYSVSSQGFSISSVYNEVFLHEICHSLGLGHSSAGLMNSNMNFTTDASGTLQATFYGLGTADFQNIVNGVTFGATNPFGTGVKATTL